MISMEQFYLYIVKFDKSEYSYLFEVRVQKILSLNNNFKI